MKTNKFINSSFLLAIGFSLTACFSSQPDISGVWIPQSTPQDATFYSYLTINKLDEKGNYKVKTTTYQIQNINKFVQRELPILIGSKEKTVMFIKDNTYCSEGSLATDCLIFSDDKLRESDTSVFFVKASKTPEIPVIR